MPTTDPTTEIKTTPSRARKDSVSPADRAELDALHAADEEARSASRDAILQTGWAKLEEAYSQAKLAGRALLLFGVRALQLKSVLPYGEFGKQLAMQCPGISKSSAYRAMQALNLLGGELFPRWEKSGELADSYLAKLAEALTGQGEPDLLGKIDFLVEGKSNRQLLLQIKTDQAPTYPMDEEKNRSLCLTHFSEDPNGPGDEERWRWEAECGDITWAQCWQKITGSQSQPRKDLDGTRVKTLLKNGIHRMATWGTADRWMALSENDRSTLMEEWVAALPKLDKELRYAAILALKGGVE